MAIVQKFASDIDGTVFDTEADQIAYDSTKRNEAVINAFLDKFYPLTEPQPLFNEDGSPKLDKHGNQIKSKTSPARAIVAKGLALFLADTVHTAPEEVAA